MNRIEFLAEAPLGRMITIHTRLGNFKGILLQQTTTSMYLLDDNTLHDIPNEEMICLTYHDVPESVINELKANMSSAI